MLCHYHLCETNEVASRSDNSGLAGVFTPRSHDRIPLSVRFHCGENARIEPEHQDQIPGMDGFFMKRLFSGWGRLRRINGIRDRRPGECEDPPSRSAASADTVRAPVPLGPPQLPCTIRVHPPTSLREVLRAGPCAPRLHRFAKRCGQVRGSNSLVPPGTSGNLPQC